MVLPSKKVLSIFIVVAALVVAVMIGFGRDKSTKVINYASNIITGEKVSIPENVGWQKELSKMAANFNIENTKESTSTPQTVTDTLSQSLMANYMALKQSGKLDNASAQKLVDQSTDLVNQLGSQNAVLDTTLNVIPDNGNQSIIDYGENLGNIFRNYMPKEPKNETVIINDAISTKKSSKLDELDGVITIYEKIAADLVKMPVPKTFVKAHLDTTNGIKAAAIALKEIKFVFSDPVRGLTGLQLYKKGYAIFIQSVTATKSFVASKNIMYKQGSGGYYLMREI